MHVARAQLLADQTTGERKKENVAIGCRRISYGRIVARRAAENVTDALAICILRHGIRF